MHFCCIVCAVWVTVKGSEVQWKCSALGRLIGVEKGGGIPREDSVEITAACCSQVQCSNVWLAQGRAGYFSAVQCLQKVILFAPGWALYLELNPHEKQCPYGENTLVLHQTSKCHNNPALTTSCHNEESYLLPHALKKHFN